MLAGAPSPRIFISRAMSLGNGLTAELLRGDELGPTELELWRHWQNADPAIRSPFLAPDYARAVSQVHPGARIAVLARGGRIEAFLPFQYPTRLGRALAHGEPIGGPMTDAVGVIAAPDFAASPTELLHASGLRSFLFTHLVTDQGRCGLVADQLDQGLSIELITAAGYWDELRGRRRHVFEEIERRRRRAIEELGPLTFRLDAPSPFDALERLIALKTKQYRRTGVANALDPAWKRDLLRRLAALRAPDCAGVMSTLEAGGRLLAAHFGLRGGTVLHYWFPAYDPDHARYAPGRLLLAAIIDAAGEHGIARIERGIGTTPAKRDFANVEVTYGRGLLLAPGLRGGAVRLALAARWRWQAALRRSWKPRSRPAELA